jgi:glycyl-tRNA synthetase beta chain
MEQHELLFELGVEEMPPKALKTFSETFDRLMLDFLLKEELTHKGIRSFFTPRRLAIVISSLDAVQKDKVVERLGPSIALAYNEDDGTPSKAALGFAKSCGVEFDQLGVKETPKGKRISYCLKQKGKSLQNIIPGLIIKALKQLPIPKMMRWGDGDLQFVRPVHWVVLMYGSNLIKTSVLGKETSKQTYGHRFHSSSAFNIDSASTYEIQMQENYVIVDPIVRKQMILSQLDIISKSCGADVIVDEDLLGEVNALVEYPNALCCEFPKDYLRVPQEALVKSMREHQKCFSILNNNGELLNKFVTISNIAIKETDLIVKGNTKVMNARLADAAFFYDTDLKKPLVDYVEMLSKVTFQHKLGSLMGKTQRISRLAGRISKLIGGDIRCAERAGMLSKADLMTNMVKEFPALQGIMGEYYAKASGEDLDVARALNEQYLPRFSGDRLPNNQVSISLALADKLDTLIGIFGIGLKPTGDKDPYALRRSALGVLRIIKEKALDISLEQLIDITIDQYKGIKLDIDTKDKILVFSIDRLKGIFREEGYTSHEFEAVMSVAPKNILDCEKRIQGVKYFSKMPSCANLATANKRVSKLLEKNNISEELMIDKSRVHESAETTLLDKVSECESELVPFMAERDYIRALSCLSALDKPVNDFFDHIMIMSDDLVMRNNRLALLQKVYNLFRKVADISKLSV